jgi:hypothetical protein
MGELALGGELGGACHLPFLAASALSKGGDTAGQTIHSG